MVVGPSSREVEVHVLTTPKIVVDLLVNGMKMPAFKTDVGDCVHGQDFWVSLARGLASSPMDATRVIQILRDLWIGLQKFTHRIWQLSAIAAVHSDLRKGIFNYDMLAALLVDIVEYVLYDLMSNKLDCKSWTECKKGLCGNRELSVQQKAANVSIALQITLDMMHSLRIDWKENCFDGIRKLVVDYGVDFIRSVFEVRFDFRLHQTMHGSL
jgi:hypothetical protein